MADAHNWKGVQEIYGGNTADIERMFRIAEYTGSDGSKVSGLINKLVTRTHSANADTMSALEKLGISEGKFDNHFDYFSAVWDALMALDDPALLTEYTQQLFGNGAWEEAAGMIANWGDASSMFKSDIGDTGLGLTSDEIEQMDDAWKKVNELRVTWAALKTSLGTKIWIKLGLTETADNIITLMQDVAKLFDNPGDK